jgi:hypothetical protein
MVNGRLNVLHHTGRGQCLHRRFVTKAFAHVGIGVTQLHPGFDAVKGRGATAQ